MTPREEGFIAAARILYSDGEKAKRDAAYAEPMHRLSLQLPNDDEVGSFYGLALLGTKSENQDFLVAVEASDVLEKVEKVEKVYRHNPNHPGVLQHDLIHCYYHPKCVSWGLQAVDRCEHVALDSAHALHMPSHIYLDLAMWTKSDDYSPTKADLRRTIKPRLEKPVASSRVSRWQYQCRKCLGMFSGNGLKRCSRSRSFCFRRVKSE